MRRIIHLTETDSTNTYVKNLLAHGESDVCVVADRQTGGRGRLGRTFESPSGGLYMTFTHRTDTSTGDALTARVAVAAARAVERLCGLSVKIKWVNDLYAGGKKLCGILCETVWKGDVPSAAVIGVGVNLWGVLPESIRDIATTSESEGGTVPDRDTLARMIMDEFDRLTDFYEEYRDRQLFIGCTVTVHRGDENFTAVAEDIDESFAMVLRTEDGTQIALSSGEISVRQG